MNEVFSATFYATDARPAPQRRALTQEIETEICVIGGGFAGLWTARALLARGRDVVLLEAGEVAGEASGRNGGFVSAGFAERLPKIIDRVGVDHARELYRLSREGVETVRSFATEGDFGVEPVAGRLHVLRHHDEVGLRDYADMLERDFDHHVAVWPREHVRAALASERYYQALHEPDAFHLHPLNLARALAADVERRGGVIYERSGVLGADLAGLRKSVWTASGRVRAFQVVVAGNAFLGEAFPSLAATVLPVRTHVVVTAPLGEILHETIRYAGAISDTRRAGDYYRIVGERLLWGGRITTELDPPRRLAEEMGRDIARVFPQLADVPIEYAWSGTMGYAVHKMPQIGLVQPGVWVANAFGGHGLNTTAMAGELIAAAAAEQDDRWRLFIPFGLVWSGGKVGRAATQLTYWSMQFKDWMEEAQTRRFEQIQADLAAGLAPGLAARGARKAKHRFARSGAGRASARLAAALFLLLSRLFVGLRWAGAIIYAISAAIGRVLYVVIMAVATVIGFIAGWVGWGMEMVAAGIAAVARATGRVLALLWRVLVVPPARLLWAAAKWTWRRSMLGSNRLALAARAAAWRGVERLKAASVSAAHALQAGAVRGAARSGEGLAWTGARLRDGARWAAAATKTGATVAAARGKETAIVSGKRARQGAIWTAARAQEGAVWTTQKLNASARFTWERGVKPAAQRAALGAGEAGKRVKAGGARAAEGARKNAAASAAFGARLPGIAWTAALLPAGRYARGRFAAAIGVVADARRRQAEVEKALRSEIEAAVPAEPAAKTESAAERTGAASEQAAVTSGASAVAETPASEPVAADNKPEPVAADKKPEPVAGPKPKSKRKKKAKQDSIGA